MNITAFICVQIQITIDYFKIAIDVQSLNYKLVLAGHRFRIVLL